NGATGTSYASHAAFDMTTGAVLGASRRTPARLSSLAPLVTITRRALPGTASADASPNACQKPMHVEQPLVRNASSVRWRAPTIEMLTASSVGVLPTMSVPTRVARRGTVCACTPFEDGDDGTSARRGSRLTPRSCNERRISAV